MLLASVRMEPNMMFDWPLINTSGIGQETKETVSINDELNEYGINKLKPQFGVNRTGDDGWFGFWLLLGWPGIGTGPPSVCPSIRPSIHCYHIHFNIY